MLSRFFSVTALCVLPVIGCSKQESSAPADNPDASSDTAETGTPDSDAPETAVPATAADFCRAVSQRICGGMTSCSCRFDGRPYTKETCVDKRTAECVATFGAKVQPDVDAGRAAFHATSVTRCLGELDAMVTACAAAESGLPDACGFAVMDVAAIGATCTVRGGGLAFCAGAEGVCSPGELQTCTKLPTEGKECLAGLCAQGLGCDGTMCRVPGGVGTACVTGATCTAGLICAPDGKCGAPLAVGATCTNAAQCATGLRCSEGKCIAGTALGGGCNAPSECGVSRGCGRTPETRVCGTPNAAGEACTEGSCATGLACADGKCAALPGEGVACLGGTQCAPGFTCADGEGVCRKLPTAGETCLSGSRFCADGLGCDMTTNTCAAGPGAGKECLLNPPDYVCASGFGCKFEDSGNVCVALGAAGAACADDRTCAADTFCDTATNKCTARRTAGGACTGIECAAGLECKSGVCAAIPGAGAPCTTTCTTGLACKGPAGQCTSALCVMP